MILGIDPSTYFEVQAKDPHFFYQGKEVEPLSLLHDHNGCAVMRIRLWIDPYDENGKPYHGGTNDWPAFLKLAKLGMSKGYTIMLDFHYSDFWCDPSKQTMPKSWQGLSVKEVAGKVYAYTRKTLQKCLQNHLDISYIQIGNEITNGMLWPLGYLDGNPMGGHRLGYDNLCAFLSAGAKACREVMPQAKTIIHLERSGAKQLHQEFFDEITAHHVDYDIIGLSYYPYWHGTFDMLFDNVENLKSRYQKPVMIVETGYGFTLESFIANGNNGANLIDEKFIENSANHVCIPYPLTLEGQKSFVEELLKRAQEHGVIGIVYWEPLWLPLPGLEWASKEGEAYIHETQKPTHNEWANQCLFDYQGNATPAFAAFKI
jgi:arabinogalactan endo-1,4-beta-galactosidase